MRSDILAFISNHITYNFKSLKYLVNQNSQLAIFLSFVSNEFILTLILYDVSNIMKNIIGQIGKLQESIIVIISTITKSHVFHDDLENVLINL